MNSFSDTKQTILSHEKMSSFSNPDKGKLTIENFAEFSVDIMNSALRYGQAGEEIIDDVGK